MNSQLLTPKLIGITVIVAAALIAAPLLAGSAGNAGKSMPTGQTPQETLAVCRTRLNAYARHLADRSSAASRNLEMPTDAVFKMMGPEERKGLAVGADRLHDRLLSTNVCTKAEMEWETKALSLLRMRDGDAAAAVIRRVHNTPVHQVGSLEKLGQIELMMRTVYPEMVSCGEAEPSGFERSAVKKTVTRRQLYLMKRGAQ